MRIVITAR